MNKFLAQNGGISRRQADQHIRRGRVQVNGQVISELGSKIDPEVDDVRLDDVRVKQGSDRIYVLLNKPAGFLVTSSDPQGRPTVYDLLEGFDQRIFSVGRLDQDTSGVLLLTDDGHLAERLTHPKHLVIKGYHAKVLGSVADRELDKFLAGILLEDGPAQAKAVKLLSRGSRHSEIYLELTSGRKRQVKRMCAAIGHPVIELRRTIFAGMTVGELPLGKWRYLTSREVDLLKASAAETI